MKTRTRRSATVADGSQRLGAKLLSGAMSAVLAVGLMPLPAFAASAGGADEAAATPPQLVASSLGAQDAVADAQDVTVEAALVPTVENGTEYKTHVEYTDYANNGKISWGEVSLFKTEPDANGVVFWFFTNPDKANHSNEVQLSFIDRAASNESEFDLVIPSNVTVQGTTYKVTAIGPETGSSYKEYAGNQFLLAYWYDPIDEFAPDWCIGPNAKTVGNMTKDSEGYLDFAIAHPYMPVAGQNANVSEYGPVRYDANAVRDGTVNENSPQTFKDYIKPTFTSKVKSLFIPSTVETIGGNCFSSWDISSVVIADSSNLKNIDGGAFMGCKQLEALDFSTTNLESIMTPQYYRFHISGDARGYTGTEDLNGDGTVNTQDAWYDDSYGKWTNADGGLSDIPVEYTDRSVGGYSPFANCSLLRAVSLPSGVRLANTIEAVFSGCSALEELNIAGNDAELAYREKEYKRTGDYMWHSYKLVDGLLLNLDQNCTAIDWIPPAMETVVIPDSVTTFKYPDSANVNNWTSPFFNGSSAKSHAKKVVLGQGITEITTSALCSTYLEEVVLSDVVTTIGEKAFSGATSLQSIVIPESVTNIGKQAFSKCTALQSISVPGSVKVIGMGAFQGCTSLSTVDLADGIEEIGNQVFYGSGIKALTIPDSVTTFGTNVVSSCDNLETVSFGEGMSTFPKNAIANTKSLKTVMVNGADSMQYSGTLIAFLKAQYANIPENVSLYYLAPIDSLDADSWNKAFGPDVNNLGAKKLDVYGTGETLKSYFESVVVNPPSYFIDNTGENTNKATVTYTDISKSIVRIGAGADPVKVEGLPVESGSLEYTGNAITLDGITVTYGSGDEAVTLVEGTDYTVAYANNMQPGTATVTVQGKGDYLGTVSADFTINANEQSGADAVALDSVEASIAALPAEVTADNVDAVAAVADAYAALSDAAKSQLTAGQLAALVDAQSQVATVKQAAAEQALAAAEEEAAKNKQAADEAQKAADVAKQDADKAKQQAADLQKDLTAAQTAKANAEQAAKDAKAAQAKAEGEAKTAKAAQAKAAAAAKSSLKKNTLTVKAKTVKAKANKKTTAKKAKAFKVTGAKGKVAFYKVSGNAKIKVSKAGKVTVKKGLKKGKTYKVKVLVSAAGNKSYAPAFKTVTLKVKVTK